ncbi:MAG: hypothetical protein LDLANPLL_02901 [Turneriella sp.]|nr:hypothetical protein [Turneriella sp.]
MAQESSFDIVSETNWQELTNAIDQACSISGEEEKITTDKHRFTRMVLLQVGLVFFYEPDKFLCGDDGYILKTFES